MSVQDIYAAFQAAAAAGQLTGNSPDGLATLLGTLHQTALVFQNGQAQLGTDSAWLTATTIFLDTSWALKLTGRPAPTASDPALVQLELRLDAQPQPEPWTFAQAFPGTALPRSRVVDTPEHGGGLMLGPSVIAPLVVSQPALLAANLPLTVDGTPPLPRLQGWLVLTGSQLSSYSFFFGTTNLWLDGTLDFTKPVAPVLVLRAVVPGKTFAINQLAMATVGLLLRTDWPDIYPLPEQGALLSIAMVCATVAAATRTLELTAPLFAGDYVWPLHGTLAPPLNLSGAIDVLTTLMSGTDAAAYTLPAGVAGLDKFGISDFEFGMVPPTALAPIPTVQYSLVSVRSLTGWNPPVPFVKIEQVGVTWMFEWNHGGRFLTATVFGTMAFGSKKQAAAPAILDANGDPVLLDVSLELPNQVFTARTRGAINLSMRQGFQAYFDAFPDTPATLAITEISFVASLLRQTYTGTLVVEGQWPVTAGVVTFNLDSIELSVTVAQGAVSGAIQGITSIAVPGENAVLLQITAEYPGDGYWTFGLQLFQGPLNLLKFVAAFLGVSYPSWMDNDTFRIDLLELGGSYSTAPNNPYSVNAKLQFALKDTVVGIPLSLTASASIARRLISPPPPPPASPTQLVGSVSGTFAINRFVLSAGVAFQDAQKTYTFSIAYRGVKLIATTAWVKKPTDHQIITFRLEGVTLGSIVEYFVNLANPNLNFRLEAPWDVLDSIDLSRFALIIDPTLQTIRLTYQIQLDLVFVSLTSVGILYDRASGEPTVKLVVEGTFLGQDRTGDNALVWDAANDAPPEIPGKGAALFDLRYLGLGQHVTPTAITKYDSVSAVLDALRAVLVPLKDGATQVPIDPAKLNFDEGSEWLIGFDATFMDTVTVKLIMHDPDLYGILLSLAGPEAGALAGFAFELLYKKITNDVGVFHARLQVPDLFRQIQLGTVSITLGVITVDIFTNGNFRVDLGFPKGRDFTDSFAVEVAIFNGRGGIYFGLLDGATSTRVPRITNGQFSPVIELGVGLMVGVGRTFEKGPLSAGLEVDLLAIFEGTLGWFHPNDSGANTAMYYWCRGTAGIVGRLYGSVDFKIISVDISVEAYATATLTLECYQATLVELDVGVSVHASIKILFVRISFSFGLQLHASFTIGSASTPPWTLAANQDQAHAARRRRPADIAAATRRAHHLTRATATDPNGYHLVFNPTAQVFPNGEVRTGTLVLAPAFTIAGVPVAWANPPPPPPATPDYRMMVAIFADCAVPPDPARIAETHQRTVATSAHAETPALTTFDQLAEGMLRWSLWALGIHSPAADVSLGQLEELVDQLALPQAADQGFTWDNLDGFFATNLHLALGAPATGAPLGCVPFPMIPALQWTTPDLPAPYASLDFWTYQPVDQTYADQAQQYFATLDPQNAATRAERRAARAAVAVPDVVESMARFVFRDYFLMVARAVTQAAVDLLTAFPHVVAPTDSLLSIVGDRQRFPTTLVPYVVIFGDSVAHVASVLGMSVRELLGFNPTIGSLLAQAPVGSTLQLAIGPTVEQLASANPTWPIAPNVTIHLGTLAAPIQASDTIARIAARYTVVPAALFAAVIDDELLAPGAPLPLPAFTYANPQGLSLPVVAALYYVRLPLLAPNEDVPYADWYAEAINAANPGAISDDGALPNPCLVPVAHLSSATTAWIPLPGDTLASVAATLALAQNVPVDPPAFQTWLAAVIAANAPPPATGVRLPATTVATVAARDTLAALMQRLLQPGEVNLQALLTIAPILRAPATIDVPGATQQTAAGFTLITLAQSYNLSLEALAVCIQTDVGVLAVSLDPAVTLTVPGVPAIDLATLTDALHAGKPAATIAGQVARFMLYGLRLPAPVLRDGVYTATGPMTGVYEMVGQLVPGPVPAVAPPPIDPAQARVTLTIAPSQPASWLTFAQVVTTGERDTVGALERAHPALHALNPALRTRAAERADTMLPPGMIVHVATTSSLVVVITNAQIAYPDSVLLPALVGGLAAMPLARAVAIRHPVTHPILWQTTDPPALPVIGPTTAAPMTPTLWLLSDELMATAATGASAGPYLVEELTPQAGPAVVPTELGMYAWAVAIDLAVHRLPGRAGTIELLGADTADRQRLALLLEYLGVIPAADRVGAMPPPPIGEAVTWKLAWQLPSSSPQAGGLTTTVLSRPASFLVKVNLSTETHSGPVRALGAVNPSAGPYFASFADADASRFLTLVWECSVVGGGGYWLHHEALDGSPGVPDAIFDQDGRGTLTLIIQLASQSTVLSPWPVRTLFAFNNCVVVGDGVDPGSIALFAATPGETTTEATVEPGNVGFTLDLSNPGSASTITPTQQALQQLYGLIGYQLTPTTAFGGSREGPPIGPDVKTNGGVPDEDTWHVARVVPIYRLANAPSLPALPGFPDPLADPYAGINGNGGVAAQANVQLWFHDVFGDASAAPTGTANDLVGQVPIPVGYTDQLLAVGAWPATTLRYAVTPPPTPTTPITAVLAATVTMQAIAYQPAGGEAGDVAAQKAATDRGKYARIYYQLLQPDVTAALRTSLQQAPSTDPVRLPIAPAPLRTYAMGAYTLLGAIAQLGPYRITAATQPDLAGVVATYGVDYDAIGAANAARALQALFATPPAATQIPMFVPTIVMVPAGTNVSALCQRQDQPPDPATVLRDPDNVGLPLQPGTEVAVPPHAVTVPSPAPSVNDLVALWRCSLASIVAANAAASSLLTPGFVFDCNGYEALVPDAPPGSDATLNGVVSAFIAHGLPYDAATIVQMNAEKPAMFRAGATLRIDHYVIQRGDTLAVNAGGFTPSELAPLITQTDDLFPVGTPLFLQALSAQLPAATTLGDTAAVLGMSPGELLRHNPDTQLANQLFAVPGLVQWPGDPTALTMPFTIRATDTLASIGGACLGAPTAAALAQLNHALPGLLGAGTIVVGAQRGTVQAGDTIDTVCGTRFSPPITIAQLAGAIGAATGYLAPGALVLVPPGRLPAAAGPLTPVQAAAPYGVSPSALLSANAGVPGVITGGVTLAASPQLRAVTVVTAPSDSLTAIVRRLQQRGFATSIDDVVAANLTIAFVVAGATVIVPPADAIATATLGGFASGPSAPIDAPWEFPAPIFPIHVWLELARSWTLCNADLRGPSTAPTTVVQTRTAIPVARQGLAGDRQDGGAVTLTGFATALEAAVPAVRVATGKVLSEQEDAASTDVWAVVFSPARIAAVNVSAPIAIPGVPGPQPRTYALKPLVNELVARRGVTIQTLAPTTGGLTGGALVDYQGVDLEVWARSFLADLDLLLSAQYVPGAYAINSTALEAIITAKQALAAAVARGLDYVLQGQGGPGPARDSAVESLRQQLLISLSRGYATSAVIQYDSAVGSTWATEVARFNGSAAVTFTSSDPQLKAASVSNSKVSLANGTDHVNLLVAIPDVEQHETLPMTLAFQLVELEFNIVTEIDGYDRSDWLAFVNPVVAGSPPGVAIALGSPVVPLPLRAYPPMPALLDQHAVPPTDPRTIDAAVRWTYSFQVRHQSAAQDEILLAVQFNQATTRALFEVPNDDLFAKLAQYVAISAPLVGMLGALADWKTIATPAVIATALQTYATLAAQLASAWENHWPDTPPDARAARVVRPSRFGAPRPEAYAYTMTMQADAGVYTTLTLLRTAKSGAVGWPDLYVVAADGTATQLMPSTACACPPAGDCQCYDFPTGAGAVPAFSLVTLRIDFGGLHVASYQNATASVRVTRNAALFAAPQPATTAGFVYTTPTVSYAEAVVPFISVGTSLPIAAWSYVPSACPLNTAFATIFDNDPAFRTIACGVRYGYQLAAGSPPLESFLPVKQSPTILYASTTVGDAATALQRWNLAEQPNPIGGRYAFWIDLYSTIDPALQRPLLQLKRIISKLDG